MKGLTADDHHEFDPADLVAMLVLGEARGATELQMSMIVPPMWREGDLEPQVIHDERRVYDDGELING